MLVPRWPLVRAASLLPLLIMVASAALVGVTFTNRPRSGGDMSGLIIAVVTMIGFASIVTSFAAGLLAGGLRLRYLARR